MYFFNILEQKCPRFFFVFRGLSYWEALNCHVSSLNLNPALRQTVQRAMSMMSLETLSSEESSKKLGWLSLEKKMKGGDDNSLPINKKHVRQRMVIRFLSILGIGHKDTGFSCSKKRFK